MSSAGVHYMRGTPLQKAIWRELFEIPHGETTSYGELAARVDWSGSGADGSLTGYGGGLQRKQALLDLERQTVGEWRLSRVGAVASWH